MKCQPGMLFSGPFRRNVEMPIPLFFQPAEPGYGADPSDRP